MQLPPLSVETSIKVSEKRFILFYRISPYRKKLMGQEIKLLEAGNEKKGVDLAITSRLNHQSIIV